MKSKAPALSYGLPKGTLLSDEEEGYVYALYKSAYKGYSFWRLDKLRRNQDNELVFSKAITFPVEDLSRVLGLLAKADADS